MPRFKVKDLMVNVLPQELGQADEPITPEPQPNTQYWCGIPPSYCVNCSLPTWADLTPGISRPPITCGNWLSCWEYPSIYMGTDTCGFVTNTCRFVTDTCRFNGSIIPTDPCNATTLPDDFLTTTIDTITPQIDQLPDTTLQALKGQLRDAIGKVEAREAQVNEAMRPQTTAAATVVEQKLEAALEEIRAHKARLQAASSSKSKP